MQETLDRKAPAWRWSLAQKAEIRWWRHYLRGKPPADYLAWKRAYWAGFLQSAGLQLPSGSKVLDVGCGPAGVFLVLETCRLTAVDPLLERYERTLPHFRRADYPHVQFVSAPFETAPLEGSFDCIFCLNALNHLRDPLFSLRKMNELLRAGGRLCLSVDVHRHGWLRRLFQRLPGDVLHPHQWEGRHYHRMVEAAGFGQVREQCLKRGKIFDYQLFTATK